MFKRILVICTGNICRSPMGEGLLRARLPAVDVLSAGTSALIGQPADPHAQAVMLERGVDISGHRAQQVTLPLLTASDLILTMERAQSDWITGQYPQLHGRVHQIRKWLDNEDVPDPYRQPRAAFEYALHEIAEAVDAWLQKMG